MKSKAMRHLFCRSAFAACLMGTAVMMPSCEDDLLTGQPSWLGNSIYERLEEDGNYKTTLKLIEDLGQYDVLSKTGSKTLFVADDAAYDVWYQTNDWGVRKYEDLTMAQKKLLFNSSMVNNAYLVELLSNVSGPDFGERAGKCMRRPSAVSIYDSISPMLPDDMPVLISEEVAGYKDPWAKFRNKENGLILVRDNNPAPMIHFLPAFMQYNKFTDEDLKILTNGKATSTKEAWVNGQQIIDRDITCKNGYIHKVAGVIEPTVNMAEFIRQQADDETLPTSIWSSMIDRFSAPYYNEAISKEYRRLYNGTDQDSVYILRYFSQWSSGNGANNLTPDGERVADLLPFDPGWNTYMYSNTSDYTMYYDAGVMIVPTDEAMQQWFVTEGAELIEQFGHHDSIPSQTLKELLGANMVESFTDKIPSKFENILDASTQLPLGIQPGDVKLSYMGCNGVVFVTDKVFTPRSYSSVAFPAMIREETMKVIYWAFDNLDFLPYLNSMDSRYSLLLPTNNAMLWYVDPVSYGTNQTTLLEFYYDKDYKEVRAARYNCTVDSVGGIEKGIKVQTQVSQDIVKDRLNDLVDQLIIVGDIEDGNEYYKTKGGTPVRVVRDGNDIQIFGLWQQGYNKPLTVTAIYDKTEKGNGKSYEINEQMPLASTQSVYSTLMTNPDYEEFKDLITGGDPNDPKNSMMISVMGSGDKYACAGVALGNNNVRLFENYNYTVYVPTNQAIRELIENGMLPTWEDFDYQDSLEVQVDDQTPMNIARAQYAKQVIKERITDFVRYHLQDNSVIIGAAPVSNMAYESMLVNDETGRFFGLDVTCDHNGLTIIDQTDNEVHVKMTNPANYNNICREFWFTAAAGKLSNASTIYMESDAVVHQIDGVLRHKVYEETWEQEAERRFRENYKEVEE